ncbi:MAG: heavy-metal-associated domain-containing protein [Lentisphaerae bacterium]|nr:heavy-metal-associated domain-containing protein [Lentisphaerota bacterium]
MKSSATQEHALFPACLACLVLGLALGTASCRKADMRKVDISVPGMTNQACATLVQNSFMTPQGVMQGIKTIQPDLTRRVVTITYDSMKLARKNLEYTIAGAGFDANDVKAQTNPAALPPR